MAKIMKYGQSLGCSQSSKLTIHHMTCVHQLKSINRHFNPVTLTRLLRFSLSLSLTPKTTPLHRWLSLFPLRQSQTQPPPPPPLTALVPWPHPPPPLTALVPQPSTANLNKQTLTKNQCNPQLTHMSPNKNQQLYTCKQIESINLEPKNQHKPTTYRHVNSRSTTNTQQTHTKINTKMEPWSWDGDRR